MARQTIGTKTGQVEPAQILQAFHQSELHFIQPCSVHARLIRWRDHEKQIGFYLQALARFSEI